MPPANSPPNCGAVPKPESFPFPPPPPSELARARPGVGASPPGGLGAPGIGGAPDTTGPLFPDFFSTIGAERSLVTAGFNRVPFEMSPSKAPWTRKGQLRRIFLLTITGNCVTYDVRDIPPARSCRRTPRRKWWWRWWAAEPRHGRRWWRWRRT